MKKVRVLLLCIMAVMLMACLAGCSSRRDNDTNQNTSAAGSTTAGESGSGTAAQGTESTRQDGTEDSTNNYGDDMNSTENENGAGSTGRRRRRGRYHGWYDRHKLDTDKFKNGTGEKAAAGRLLRLFAVIFQKKQITAISG